VVNEVTIFFFFLREQLILTMDIKYIEIPNGENRLVHGNGFFGIHRSSSATGKSIIICWPLVVDCIVIASLVLYILYIKLSLMTRVFSHQNLFIRTSNGVLFYTATLQIILCTIDIRTARVSMYR